MDRTCSPDRGIETGKSVLKHLSENDLAECEASIRNGSKSFYAASLLLPAHIRKPARALYAFCRSSDDLVDGNGASGKASAFLKARIEDIYADNPGPSVADRAFHAVAKSHAIPKSVPLALIEGFEWDEQGRQYRSIDELLDYAARVASTVGVMMTLIMGIRNRHVLARASELGLAMQLTNIARDVGEDARNGRIYLPLDWLREAGIDPQAFLADPSFSVEIGMVVKRLLQEADRHYRIASTGVTGLPRDCRTAIRAAAMIYGEIGREIRSNRYDSVSTRAWTSRSRKLQILCLAAMPRLLSDPVSVHPVHPSVAFLVDAAASRHGKEESGMIRFIDLLANAQRRHVARTARARRGLSRA